MKGRKTKREEVSKRKVKLPVELQCVNLDAAGIDVGAESHWVAVPTGRAEQTVREFSAFTSDLHALADWLKACGVKTVAMESTGVYWIPLYEVLERQGFEVLLVNPRHLKSVPGRKSDVLDCQWLQQLHTYGLLRGAFRPADDMCVLRGYLRQRAMLVEYASAHIQHMQKALTQMNIKLQHVLSDLSGKTGQAIIQAILAGERDAHKLAALRDRRCQRDEATIAKALEGTWREEHLFALRQSVELYETYRVKIDECDREAARFVNEFDDHPNGHLPPESDGKHAEMEPMCQELVRMTGVDLTRIEGIDTNSALKLISEIGIDMSKWPSEKHFASWLCVCPGTDISGGKRLSSHTRSSSNRAAAILRLAAQSLHRSQSAMGAYYRRMRARLGAPKAITATAHKLALRVYHMLKYGGEYVVEGQEAYEKKFHDRTIRNLKRKAAALGFNLMPINEMQSVALA